MERRNGVVIFEYSLLEFVGGQKKARNGRRWENGIWRSEKAGGKDSE